MQAALKPRSIHPSFNFGPKRGRGLILSAIFAAFCAFPAFLASQAASAQERVTTYTVANVRVDESAANGPEARTQGFAAAQRQAFARLAERLSKPDEFSRFGVPQIDDPSLDRMAISVDVNEERRSGSRYIARLTVRFDAEQVRAALRASGYTALIETRAQPVVIAPVLAPGSTPDTLTAWRAAWTDAGLDTELAPILIAPTDVTTVQDWTGVQAFAAQQASNNAVFATLSSQGGQVLAVLTEVGPNGLRREKGAVTAQISGLDSNALRGALDSLVDQVNRVVQADWKARAAVAPTPRVRVSATVLYSSQAEWERIKSGLEGAAATSISQIRIEAVGRNGALVSFAATNDRSALGQELNRHGISIEDSPSGMVLRAAPH